MEDPMNLTGRRALVTAGSRGIGAAVASALIAAGAEVFITGTTDKVAETAAQIKASGSSVADFAVAGSATQCVREATEALGAIDIVVSNTGGPQPASFDQLTMADWDGAYRLLLSSAIELTTAALPGMMDAGWGRLLYITSVGVIRPVPGLHLSNVMRSGVQALATSLAREVGPAGVTTHTIAPAGIDTERNMNLVKARAREAGASVEEIVRADHEKVPARRYGDPHEVGALAVYLCSDSSGFQTGQTHVVDGGYLLA